MKLQFFDHRKGGIALLILFFFVVGLRLIACGGGGSGQGTSGSIATPIPLHGGQAGGDFTNVTISNATIANQPTVNFTVFDSFGRPVTGLTSDNFEFIVAKLIPGTNGDADHWQNYINVVETKDPGEPGTEPDGFQTWQPETEVGGNLVDHGDGSYTYTFITDITNVTLPGATPVPTPDVSFQPGLLHRITVEISSGAAPGDDHIDLVPNGSTPPAHRNIVTIESCNECHGQHNNVFIMDGRHTELCVTCHNPGNTDANSGNTLDFKVLIHKIHRGENLINLPYTIWEGEDNNAEDFSDLAFPQDLRNCVKCHNGANPATPEGDNWKKRPTMQACGSCHDDVDFSTGVNHPGGVQTDNSQCATCHPPTGTPTTGISITDAHIIPEKEAAKKFAFNIVSVTNNGPGQFPVVTYEVVDPTNNNQRYDISTHPAFSPLPAPAVASLSIAIGWDTRSYHNYAFGQPAPTPQGPAYPIVINALAVPTPTPNPDGTFTKTSTIKIPTQATGSGVVAMYGRVRGQDLTSGLWTLSVPIKADADTFFPITDTTAIPRRQVVEISKCDQCHDVLSLHGGSRSNETQMCIICHNPNMTDRNRRPTPYPTNGIDGKPEESVDFKYMIHAIHAGDASIDDGFRTNGITVYGFGNVANSWGHYCTPGPGKVCNHMRFPGKLNDCETCHLPGTYNVALDPSIEASTILTGPSLLDPSDNTRFPSALEGACISCHDTGVP